MEKTSFITLPAASVPVKEEAEICVIGGSCTGVFAAVRAARLGKKVVLAERMGKFGGVATLDFVSIWHSIYDFAAQDQIIGGLTFEMLERLERHHGVSDFRDKKHTSACGIRLNTDELTLELDSLVAAEKNIRVLLHTDYAEPVMSADGRRVEAVAFLNFGNLPR